MQRGEEQEELTRRKGKQEESTCKLGDLPTAQAISLFCKIFVNISLALAHSAWQVLLAT